MNFAPICGKSILDIFGSHFCERKISRRELSIVTENLFCQKKGIRNEDYEFQIELLR